MGFKLPEEQWADTVYSKWVSLFNRDSSQI
jgi:hypothetical protein